jgi:hypothetical protein
MFLFDLIFIKDSPFQVSKTIHCLLKLNFKMLTWKLNGQLRVNLHKSKTKN